MTITKETMPTIDGEIIRYVVRDVHGVRIGSSPTMRGAKKIMKEREIINFAQERKVK